MGVIVINFFGGLGPLAGQLDIVSYQETADHSDIASGSFVTFTTISGALRADVVPSGGTGSYTFSWTLTKISENSDTGSRFSIKTLGTTNTSTFQPTIDGARPANAGQAFDSEFEAECVIGDGVSNVTVSNITFRVIALAF